MGRYKRFLYTQENILRSTVYRRRQRACQKILKYWNSCNLDQNTILFATTSTLQNNVEKTGAVVSQDNLMSVNKIIYDLRASCS